MPTYQVLDKIRTEIIESGRDTRYKPAAYLFVLNGLEYYLTKIGEKRHVTGQEFAIGLAEFAAKQFGPMALPVLLGWGIGATNDFGSIVYNLIAIELMSKRAEDSIDDFSNVIDLREYFEGLECFEIDREHIRRIRGA